MNKAEAIKETKEMLTTLCESWRVVPIPRETWRVVISDVAVIINSIDTGDDKLDEVCRKLKEMEKDVDADEAHWTTGKVGGPDGYFLVRQDKVLDWIEKIFRSLKDTKQEEKPRELREQIRIIHGKIIELEQSLEAEKKITTRLCESDTAIRLKLNELTPKKKKPRPRGPKAARIARSKKLRKKKK